MSNQHKYGQHYTPKVLTIKHIKDLTEVKNKKLRVVDPFVGEGNLLIDYLSIFNRSEQIEILEKKLIKGFDIDKSTIKKVRNRFKEEYKISDELLKSLFEVNNSLKNKRTKKNDFILTNPPYLARNTCKKKYNEEFNINFKDNNYIDYYEMSLDIYGKNEGIWIIPSNFISSDLLNKKRKELLKLFNIENINLFEIPIFEGTNISVVTFILKKKKETQSVLNINFIKYDREIKKEIDIDENGNICSEWIKETKIKENNAIQGLLRENIEIGNIDIIVLNENYKIEKMKITEDEKNRITKNILFLRSTDTGTKEGKLGLYELKELFPKSFYKKEPITLLTKKTSRLCVPIFFKDELTKEEQKKIKENVNKKLEKLRNKYNSIFLTNFKNTTNSIARKRITFKEIYGLIERSMEEMKEVKEVKEVNNHTIKDVNY